MEQSQINIKSEKMNDDQQQILFNIKKHTKIAIDMERQGLMQNAKEHYQKALNQSKSLDKESYFKLLTNVIKISTEMDQSISALITVLSNDPNHVQWYVFI